MQSPGGESAAWRLVIVAVALSLFALIASEVTARSMRRRRADDA